MALRDKIALYDMQFWAYHGVFEAEKTLGQRFHIDVTLSLDLTEAGQTDDLTASVSYADVFRAVEQVVVGQRFDLLEALALNIINAIFAVSGLIDSVEVTVKKPQAPIPGHFAHAAVTMTRSRSEVLVR